jgi:MPBQ/MSBQ methyltransferase
VRALTDRLEHAYDRIMESAGLGDAPGHSDFWNYGYWYEDTGSHRQACENLMEELLAFIPEQKGRILDVACGKGATTRYLLHYYPAENVTGINISEKQLRVCRETAPGCTFLRMDATKMAFPDNSFHNIICVEAAMHFATRRNFLVEAQRVLKPGGCLVLSDAIFPRWRPDQPVANYVRSPREYRRTCVQAGFADVTVVDATDECWGGFTERFLEHMREELRGGEIGLQRFYRTVAWRLNWGPELYVLASCVKR